jgi:hypothetical protein
MKALLHLSFLIANCELRIVNWYKTVVFVKGMDSSMLFKVKLKFVGCLKAMRNAPVS